MHVSVPAVIVSPLGLPPGIKLFLNLHVASSSPLGTEKGDNSPQVSVKCVLDGGAWQNTDGKMWLEKSRWKMWVENAGGIVQTENTNNNVQTMKSWWGESNCDVECYLGGSQFSMFGIRSSQQDNNIVSFDGGQENIYEFDALFGGLKIKKNGIYSGISTKWFFIHCFQSELEFRHVDFCGGRKTREPREKPLDQGQ